MIAAMRCWSEDCRSEVAADAVACPACGALLRVGGSYRVAGKRGEGGTGVVYQAVDETLDRPVAIKLLHGSLGDDPETRQRFQTECKAMAALDHRGIARIYAAGSQQGRLYFVQELVSGEGFAEHVRRLRERGDGKVDASVAVDLVVRLLEALAHAHEKGIAHRDVTPNNVLMSERDGRSIPVLIDFGMARITNQDATQEAWGGTPGYAAPEEILDPASNDCRSDLYSAGAVLYWLLSGGRVPYDEAMPRPGALTPTALVLAYQAIVDGRVCCDRLDQTDPRIPSALSDALERALAPALADRYDSAEAMIAALRPFGSVEPTEPAAAEPAEPTEPAEPSGRAAPPLLKAALLVGLVAAAALVAYLGWDWHAAEGPAAVARGAASALKTAASGSATAGAQGASRAAVLAPLLSPAGLDVGPDGAVYVADQGNHRIRVVRQGKVQTLAGTNNEGFADGPSGQAKLSLPCDVDLGADGRLYVADRGNHRIRVIHDGQVSTLAGGFEAGFRNGARGQALLDSPAGVTVGPDGAVYVADTGNHCIRLVRGEQVSTLAGSGTAGHRDGPVATARFSTPVDLQLDAQGTLYVAEWAPPRIRAIRNGQVSTVADIPTERHKVTTQIIVQRFAIRTALTIGPNEQLFVSDPDGRRVWKLVGQELHPWAGTGQYGRHDDYLPKASFHMPMGLAVGPAGEVYVTDAAAAELRVIRKDKVATVIRSRAGGFADGTAAEAQFNRPWGLAVRPDGAVVIGDWVNRRVRELRQGKVSTLAGTGDKGVYDGDALDAQFASPWGVALDPQGAVYVADGEAHRIRVLSSGEVRTLAGTGEPGFADGPTGQASFRSPEDVVLGARGQLYVADTGNHRIRVIEDGRVRTLAGTGEPGRADGDALSARFNGPAGLALGPDERLYVADVMNHSIRVVHDRRVHTLAGTGQPGFGDGQQRLALFEAPTDLALAADGTLVVADSGNHRVRAIRNGLVHTLAGTGQPGYGDGPSLEALLFLPVSVAVGSDGTVYVAEAGNHLLRAISAGQVRTAAGE